MMQLAGLGGLRPNTIVMGYQAPRLDNETDDPPHVDAEEYVRTIRKSFNFMFNVVIAKGFKTFDFSKKRNNGTIDIWWLSDDGGLTLLLAHLISQFVRGGVCACVAHDRSTNDVARGVSFCCVLDGCCLTTRQAQEMARVPIAHDGAV